MKTLTVVCGTCRHPQQIPVSHIATLDDDLRGQYASESIVMTLKPRRWIKDTFGDGQWHGTVVAERGDVAKLLRLVGK